MVLEIDWLRWAVQEKLSVALRLVVQCFVPWGLSYCNILCRNGCASLCIYPQYCWKHPLPTEHVPPTVFSLSLCPLFALLAPISEEYIKQLLIFWGIHDLWTPFLSSFLPHPKFSTTAGQPSLLASLECLSPLSVNLHKVFLAVHPACQAKEILCQSSFLQCL